VSIETVAAAIVRLADTNKGALGLATAKDPPPATLDTAVLPCLYVWTGPGQYSAVSLGSDAVMETRLYRLQVAVAPEGEASPEFLEARTRPILVAVRDLYFGWPQLDATDWVQTSAPASDSGVILLPEYGGKYVGFELRLEVQEHIKRIYQE
jgi:hypothetical protein